MIEISSDQVFGYKHGKNLFHLFIHSEYILIEFYRLDMTLWPLASSPWITIIGWMAVTIYLLVVLSIIIVLCGIQLVHPRVHHFTPIVQFLFLLETTLVDIHVVYSNDHFTFC